MPDRRGGPAREARSSWLTERAVEDGMRREGDIRGDEEEEGTVGEERGDRGWGLREEGAGARVVADCSMLYTMET
jgi:hypothetical protein